MRAGVARPRLRGIGAAAVILGLARAAGAHWVPPEAIVAQLNGEGGRRAGVERAVRDEHAPRLLVIRVGARWYARTVEARRRQAESWLEHWRRNVPQGMVAVLDARTDLPVVRIRRGTVLGVVPAAPPAPGAPPAPPPVREPG